MPRCMAVYTDITDEELAALLADFNLGCPLAFKGIAEGIQNSNFVLETETGRFILTVFERGLDEHDLPYFLDLMHWLADRGFPSATPMEDRNGQMLKHLRGKPAAIVRFLNGLSVRRPTVAHCREAGVGLARMHLTAKGFTGHRDNDLGQPFWAPMFTPLRGPCEDLKPGLAATIESDLAKFEAAWPKDLPTGVIHADYFPDNVFFQGDKFAAAIDFYYACNDFLAYDVAIALNAWCFEPDGSFNITNARALVSGYSSLRPLTAEERAALPILAHGAAMRFFLYRLKDWGETPAGALVQPKDPMEYERKLAVHRASPDLVLFGDGR